MSHRNDDKMRIETPGLLPDHERSDRLNQVYTAGADVVTRAIVHAVLSASSSERIPSYRELYPQATRGYRR